MAEAYIFDLYGTLFDVKTDENSPVFWKRMAAHYGIYGAGWKAGELKQAYFRMCGEETLKLKSGIIQYPEIDLLKVFERLYKEAPSHHTAEQSGIVGESWTVITAGLFRMLSTKKLKLYKDTVPALKRLKEEGKKIYLLSNAQRVFTIPEMEKAGICEYFDDIFISSDYGMKKPQKEFMEALLQKHHIDPQTAVMTGNDFMADISTACACGVPSVFLNTDGYSGSQIQEQLKKLPENYQPVIIQDGRLSHLFR